MGRPRMPRVQYVGPSAAEIAAQSAAQQAQLTAQKQIIEQQFQGQLSQIQSAYGSQIDTLGKQQAMQIKQYQTQIDALSKAQAQRDQQLTETQGLLTQLKNGVSAQQSLMSTLQQGQQAALGQAGADTVAAATQRYRTNQDRTAYRQQAGASRGGGLLTQLLRYQGGGQTVLM